MTIELRYSLLALLSAVISAAYWVLTEITVNHFAVPSIVAAMWGGLLGGIMLLIVARRRGALHVGGWSRMDWMRMVVGGLLIHGAGFVLTFFATSLIGAGKANLLGQVQTFFVVVLAVIFLGERLTPRQVLGVALALLGVVLLNFDRTAMWITWGAGETLTLIARVMIAVGIVVMKPLFDHGKAAGATGIAMVVGAAFLFVVYPFSRTGPPVDAAGFRMLAVGLILALASGRGLAWLFFNASQQYIGASRAAIIFLSVSFFAVFFQLLVAWYAPGLGVRLPQDMAMALTGGVLAALGIVVVQR